MTGEHKRPPGDPPSIVITRSGKTAYGLDPPYWSATNDCWFVGYSLADGYCFTLDWPSLRYYSPGHEDHPLDCVEKPTSTRREP